MISLIALLEMILKKERKTINVEYVTCCGTIFEVKCTTIKECEEKIKFLRLKERIQELQNLTKKQQEERQNALELLNKLFKKEIEKEKEKNEKKKKNDFDIGLI